MFFLYDNLNTASFFSKTVACKQLDVNDGNDKNSRSHVRSHDNALINNKKIVQCEQVNDFSRAHVGNYFYSIYYISTLLYIHIFIFFFTCARILLFTCSHLIKINIKTMAYHVNEFQKLFARRSLVHMEAS